MNKMNSKISTLLIFLCAIHGFSGVMRVADNRDPLFVVEEQNAPGLDPGSRKQDWIPAFAGMTEYKKNLWAKKNAF